MTEQLQELAQDFGRRLSQWGWWNDAILVVGMYPKEEGGEARTVAPRVYLVGPLTEEDPPTRTLNRTTRGAHEWLSVPYPDAVDLEVFSYALATRPVPERGEYLNFLVVHFTRVGDGGVKGRFGFTHHQPMETPGAEEHLDDITWVRDTLAEIGVCDLP